jgi:hypothetical protein
MIYKIKDPDSGVIYPVKIDGPPTQEAFDDFLGQLQIKKPYYDLPEEEQKFLKEGVLGIEEPKPEPEPEPFTVPGSAIPPAAIEKLAALPPPDLKPPVREKTWRDLPAAKALPTPEFAGAPPPPEEWKVPEGAVAWGVPAAKTYPAPGITRTAAELPAQTLETMREPVAEEKALLEEPRAPKEEGVAALETKTKEQLEADRAAEEERKRKLNETFITKAIEAFRAGNKEAAIPLIVNRMKTQGASVEEIEKVRQKYMEEAEKIRPESEGVIDFIFTSVGGFAPHLLGMATYAATGAAAAGVPAAAVGAVTGPGDIPITGVAMGIGAGVGIREYWRQQGEGTIYPELVAQGLDPNRADLISKLASVPYGMLAGAQINRFLPDAAKNAIVKVVSNKLAQNALRWGKHTVEASALGAAMEANNAVAEEVGNYIQGLDTADDVKLGLSKVVARTRNAFVQMLPTMAVFTAPAALKAGAAAGARAVARRAIEAEIRPVARTRAQIARDLEVEPRAIEAPRPVVAPARKTLEEQGLTAEEYVRRMREEKGEPVNFDELTAEDQAAIEAEFDRVKREPAKPPEAPPPPVVPAAPEARRIEERPPVEERPAEPPAPPVEAVPPRAPEVREEAAAPPEEAPPPVEPPAPPVAEAPPPVLEIETPEKHEASVQERTARKGVFRKVKTVDPKLEANFQRAKELGYRKRTPGETMTEMRITTEAEAQNLNKIANVIEEAHDHLDDWEPEQLAEAVKAYNEGWTTVAKNAKGEDVTVFKVDDYDVVRRNKEIVDRLHEDGYTASGKKTRSGDAARLKYEKKAREFLRSMGKISQKEYTETPENKRALAGIKDKKERAAERDRMITEAKDSGAIYAEEELAAETKKAMEADGVSTDLATDEAAMDLRARQAKAAKRRAKAKKDRESEEYVSAAEMNEVLRKAGYGPSKLYNVYSRIAREMARPAGKEVSRTAGKAPESVAQVTREVFDDYFGDNHPKSLDVKVSRTKNRGEAWKPDEEAQIVGYNDGSADILINPSARAERLRAIVVHEIDHFGLSSAIRTDANIFRILKAEFEKDRAFFADNPVGRVIRDMQQKYGADYRNTPEWNAYVERVEPFWTYLDSYEENVRNHGKEVADLKLMDEWIAKNGERYDARRFDKTNTKVVGLVKAFLKRWAQKLGLSERDRQFVIDEAYRAATKRMRKEAMVEEKIASAYSMKPPEDPPVEPPSNTLTETSKVPAIYQEQTRAEGLFKSFDTPSETTRDRLNRHWVDEFAPLAKIQEAIKKGKKGLLGSLDTYLKVELFQGKTKYVQTQFEDKYYKPLKAAIFKSGLNMREIGLWLYARHAPERNAQKAKENPKFNEDIDFGGVRQKNPGSGMPDSLARDIVKYFEDRGMTPKLMEIEAHIKRINNYHQLLLLRHGLVDNAMIDRWNSVYDSYVPLKGFQEEGLEAMGMTPQEIKILQESFYAGGGTKGFSVAFKPKRARGRTTLANADEIISNLLTDVEMDIVRGGKNDVGRTFLKMVRENPNPEVWEIVKDPPLREGYDPRSDVRPMRIDPTYLDSDNVMTVTENGKQVVIYMHDEGLGRAMKNMGAESSNKIIRAFGTLNRFFSSVITRYSPEFVYSNFLRDIQEAMINISSEDSIKLAAETAARVPLTMRAMFRQERGKAISMETQKWADEYQRSGGTVEFLDYRNVEETQRRLMGDIDSMGNNKMRNAANFLRGVRDFVESTNSAVENATRLSYYITLRKNGFTPERSAQRAKNLTVNFNRKGEYGRVFNSLWLFSNASLQGGRRAVQVLRTPKGKAALALLAGAGLLSAEVARTTAGDEAYEKIPMFTRMRNWIIMRPDGTYYKIPIPYNFGAFYAVGVIADSWKRGLIKPLDAAGKMVSTIFNSFNPLGEGTWLQTLMPTAARPFYDMSLNKDFAGNPIKPEKPMGKEYMPESQLYFPGVSAISKGVANAMNEVSGGNQFKSGYVDISPEMMDYMVKNFTGGTGDFLLHTFSVVGKGGQVIAHKISPERVKEPEPFEPREIPFWRRMRGKPLESGGKRLFYETLEENLASVKAEYDDLLKKDHDAAVKFRGEHKNEISAYHISMFNRETLSFYSKKVKEARDAGDMEQAKLYNEKITGVLKKWEAQMKEKGIKLTISK